MSRSVVATFLPITALLASLACGGSEDGSSSADASPVDAPVASGCAEAPAVGALGLLDEIESGLQIHPSARFDGDSIWLAYTANDVENMSVFDTNLMRLGCDGQVLGAPIRATTTSGRSEIDPAIAIGQDSVALAWQSDNGSGQDNLDIVVRTFDFDGTPRSASDITLEPQTEGGAPVTGNAFYPSLTAKDGGFVLAGSNVLPGAPTFRAFINELDADGNLVGSLSELAAPGKETHSEVSVAIDDSGTAWVVYTEAQAGGDVAMLATVDGAAPLFAGTLSSTPFIASVGATRIAAASAETAGDRDIFLLATDGTAAATTSFGAPGALDHSPVIATESEERGAIAYYRNLGGFRNQLVIASYTLDLDDSSIAIGPAIEIAHQTPAPPYAPAIVHIREGVYFVAWAEGTSPAFMLRGEVVKP